MLKHLAIAFGFLVVSSFAVCAAPSEVTVSEFDHGIAQVKGVTFSVNNENSAWVYGKDLSGLCVVRAPAGSSVNLDCSEAPAQSVLKLGSFAVAHLPDDSFEVFKFVKAQSEIDGDAKNSLTFEYEAFKKDTKQFKTW